jgi:thiamine biosynthesis lipoprotein
MLMDHRVARPFFSSVEARRAPAARPRRLLLLLLTLVTALTAALATRVEARVFQDDRTKMAGPMSIRVDAPGESEALVRSAIDAAYDEVDRVVALVSEWEPASEISRVNAAAGGEPVKVGPETLALVLKAIEIGELTDGAFDITFQPLARVWDFRQDPPRLPSAAAVASARRLVDYRRIDVDRQRRTIRLPESGMAIGLGGIAKGYIVDRVAGVLRGRGLNDFVVDASGDLRVDGRIDDRQWQVGVRHPRDSGRTIARLPVSDLSIVTSGDYERYFILDGRRYHHIMDPSTGWPATGCQSVTVVTRDTGIADALATGLFVLGAERGLELAERLPEVEALIIDTSGEMLVTSGLAVARVAPVD